ncbi:MAG: M48 family metalloprotease [Alphaproteobacteria bacterium]|jgi:predicted Zn-dependent protease
MIIRFPHLVLAAWLLAAAPGCTVNPATGDQDFTPFMDAGQEAAIGAQEHPKLLAAFGGAYDERASLAAYVDSIGQRLLAVTETPSARFTFTIVNSDVVNAFALPGGYVYISRGLMALANNEAELAGVIAHEIGHVTARHSAQRYNQSVFAQLGAAVLGIATRNRALADLAGLGAAAYVQGYSRDQEFEADQLGIRYLVRAGYDPGAMADFLATLSADSALADKIAGIEERPKQTSLFASHPRTLDRVRRAAEEARGQQSGDQRLAADEYLLALEQTLFGDDPEEGLRRGREFFHPVLGFRFKVPPGFALRNTPKAVLARHPNGALVVFEGDRLGRNLDMGGYLTDVWLGGVGLRDVEDLTINGMAAATGTGRLRTRDGPRDLRAVAVRFEGDTIYRFLILTPPKITAQLSEELRRMTYSLRPVTARELENAVPQRIRIHRVEPGETVDSLAAAMPFETLKPERLRVLNGLAPTETLQPGSLIKLIGN